LRQPLDLGDGGSVIAPRIRQKGLDIAEPLLELVAGRRGLRQLAFELTLALGQPAGGGCHRPAVLLLRFAQGSFDVSQPLFDLDA
jgi:hypothetical protein